MRKSILCILLVAMMFSSSVSVSQANQKKFTDVSEQAWFYDHLSTLVEQNIIDGLPDGSFRPNETILIDQFIKTMIVALGYQIENANGYWAENYINQAQELELIEEGEFDKFAEPITRAEMARICERVILQLNENPTYTKTEQIKEKITDQQQVEETELSEYIYHMYELGILTGYPDNSFQPERTLSRAEACTVIRRVIDQEVREPFYSEEYIEIYDDGDIPNAFDIDLDVSKPLEPQWNEAENYLINKVGEEYAQQMMGYVRLKEKNEDELKLKIFGEWNGLRLYVQSGKGLDLVVIGAAM